MTSILTDRRAASTSRIGKFSHNLDAATEICKGKACVYVTGSFGRGEGGNYSDLDLFIAGRTHIDENRETARDLSNLEEICLKRELICATSQSGFLPFSGDGEYLIHYTIDELVKKTGMREDDANNTFTARLLLLLESRPLIGLDVYDRTIESVVEKYWRDYKGREKEFVPAFLANDILRLWRTFCVNYEARTSDVPEKKKMKRRLKNYKLKHSRMLTCYSALVDLLARYNRVGTVSPTDVREMVQKSPTERLEWLKTFGQSDEANRIVDELLKKYAQFLEITNEDEPTLLTKIGDKDSYRAYMDDASAFGEAVFRLIQCIGNGSRLHRLLVV